MSRSRSLSTTMALAAGAAAACLIVWRGDVVEVSAFLAVQRRPLRSPLSVGLQRNECSSRTKATYLSMTLTPVGPFCPFRSSAAMEEASVVRSLSSRRNRLDRPCPLTAPSSFDINDHDTVALDFLRLRTELQCGLHPDPVQLRTVADRVDDAVQEWELLLGTLKSSHDFATLEYVALSQLHLQKQQPDDDAADSLESMASMMRWQAECMRAMAASSSTSSCVNLPPPPANVNIAHMMQQMRHRTHDDGDSESTTPASSSKASASPLLLVALAHAADYITVPPFTGHEDAFDSSTVAHEYTTLCLDHMNLVELGGQYREFDPSSKLLYVDRMDAMAERWDVFFYRFGLLGAIHPRYVQQCDAFLARLGLTEGEYRDLLQQAHQQMRLDAVKQEMFGTP